MPRILQNLRLFNDVATGILIMDETGTIIEFNKMFRIYTEYTAEELRGVNIDDLLHEDDKILRSEHFQNLLSGKTSSLSLERRILPKEGMPVWIRMNAVMATGDSDGDESRVVALIEDITEKKNIQETLEATEIRLDGILESLEDVVYSMNIETNEIYYVNKATKNLFGLSEDDFRSGAGRWRKMIHGGDLAKVKRAAVQLRETGYSDVEYRLITPDGGLKWLRDRAWRVSGQSNRVDGIITDVTKRKLAELAHRDSEERYKAAVKNSVEAIYMVDPASLKILEVNDAFCKLLGYNPEEALSLKVFDFVDHEKHDIENLIISVVDGSGAQIGRRIWKRKDGRLLNVDITASLINQRDRDIVFVVARDVTEENQIKEQLERERALLGEVVANAPVPMALLDHELRFLVYSRNWIKSYGPVKQKLHGNKLFDVYRNSPAEWRELCKRGLEGEVLNISEQEVKLRGRDPVYLRLAIHPWGDKEEGRYGIVLVAERIDELVNARKVVEDASRAKSAFLARITHELRTPLNAILGYAQILSKDEKVDIVHRGYIDNMYRSGMHLLHMINDILDLSKIEASRMELNMQPVDIFDLVGEVVEMFRLKAQSKALVLDLYLDPSIHRFVVTDRAKLNQVLINLIGNAVKFTQQGSIYLKLKSLDQRRVDTKKQLIEFTIRDTGMGIPSDEVHRIFEPFHQASNSLSQGTGLGLSITQKVINLMGGDIQVQSVLNEGSEFAFTLFFDKAHADETVTSGTFGKVKGIKTGKSYKILVADDIEQNRVVVRLLLERLGIEVEEARNGLEAVQKAEILTPDGVIMDIIMPEMDGVKAMHKIRSSEWGRNIPIIALTASGFDDKRDKLIQAGFNDYILKPFKEEELLESLAKYFGLEFEFDAEQAKDKNNLADAGKLKKDVGRLGDKELSDLRELLITQDFEALELIITNSVFIEKVPTLCRLLATALKEYDFYFITQLAKLIESEEG